MKQDRLVHILQTTEGLEAITRLLDSAYYAPTGSGFFRFEHDPYTVKLRAFVRKVQAAIPDNRHRSASSLALDALAEDPVDLSEIQHLADTLTASAQRAAAIHNLQDLCHHLLTDPNPGEDPIG